MISSIDHIVFTVSDIPATVRFYTQVLGMKEVVFGEGRIALSFGSQKINLQDGISRRDIVAVAANPTPGAIDICFLSAIPLVDVVSRLSHHGVSIEVGPVDRIGATHKLRSVYIRDPDGNLVEISERVEEAST